MVIWRCPKLDLTSSKQSKHAILPMSLDSDNHLSSMLKKIHTKHLLEVHTGHIAVCDVWLQIFFYYQYSFFIFLRKLPSGLNFIGKLQWFEISDPSENEVRKNWLEGNLQTWLTSLGLHSIRLCDREITKVACPTFFSWKKLSKNLSLLWRPSVWNH